MSPTDELQDPQKPVPFDPVKADAQAKAILSQGGKQEDVDTFLHQTYGLTPAPGAHDFHAEYASGNLARRMATENQQDADLAAAEPTVAQRQLGGIASLGRGIPGVTAVSAGARALVQRQPYRQALSDIQQGEASSGGVGKLNALAGGTVAATAMPNSILGKTLGAGTQGAIFGGAEGLANPNDDFSGAGILNRAKQTGVSAVLGGIGGKVAETATNAARGFLTPTLGKQTDAFGKQISAADAKNYGAAEAEAAAGGGTSPAIRYELNRPTIKPLADDIRRSAAIQGTPVDDATILMQAHRELSQNERALIDRQAGANTTRPMTQREQGDVAAIKSGLRQAASNPQSGPALMPSFAPAVAEHAALKGSQEAMQGGADVAKTAIEAPHLPGKKLAKRAIEPYITRIGQMTPEDAQQAVSGVLGRTKEYSAATKNPLSAFGLLTKVPQTYSGSTGPLLSALDQRAGNTLPAMLRALGIAGGTDVAP